MANKIIEHQLPNGFSFKLCRVDGGTFQMGGGFATALPVHSVCVSSFYLAEYPVTQEFWLNVVGGKNPSYFIGYQKPVEHVSWFDAAAFCNKLNQIFGYNLVYFTDSTFQKPLSLSESQKIEQPNAIPIFSKITPPAFRLPSEAEWEYAARGGQSPGRFIYAGGDKLDEVAWYNDNSHDETKEVGLKLPNELGLYDLSGNVWEWCEDDFYDDYEGAPSDGSAWLDLDSGGSRVLRGGSWWGYHGYCLPYSRYNSHPALYNSCTGFRLAFHLPPGS